jgi:hypothetical protein
MKVYSYLYNNPVAEAGSSGMNGKFDGRKPGRRPRLRWRENIRRDSLLLLNTRRMKRWEEERNIWGRATEEAMARCGQ